ncbi:MAG: flagellar protein FlaG [Campylobacterota bacterium]|nr:flagellar protein FlaG [Campylobacterota bacterium]
MELMQNVAKMQNTQANPVKAETSAVQMQQHQAEAIQKAEVKQEKLDSQTEVKSIDSEKDVSQLVKELNDAISPFRTSLKFGFDNSSEDFFVSVIESKTNKLISRFPAEQAVTFLPKIQEVNGLMFDQKG